MNGVGDFDSGTLDLIAVLQLLESLGFQNATDGLVGMHLTHSFVLT